MTDQVFGYVGAPLGCRSLAARTLRVPACARAYLNQGPVMKLKHCRPRCRRDHDNFGGSPPATRAAL